MELPIVSRSPAIEEWLDASADGWSVVSDVDYRALVRRWRERFGGHLRAPFATQSPHALEGFSALLPATIVLFSGCSVPEAAATGGSFAHAYRATGLRSVDEELAHSLDLILLDEDFAFCCVCTHESGSLSYPIFARSRT